jgi:F-type H+-transporting ATPase subunit epsilon
MKTFLLKIGTPDGLLFEGAVERIVCRSITGDLAILAGHCNFCTALGMGEAHIVLEDGTRRSAACIGGMLSVMNGECNLLATTWEWKEDIDEARADAAKKRAQEMIERKGLSEREYKLAEAKLKRALVRLSVKG